MNSRHQIDLAYSGRINPDDEPVVSELDNLGLHNLSARSAQSVVAGDQNFMLGFRGSKRNDSPVPNPFDKEKVDTLWVAMQYQYKSHRIKPYLAPTD